MKVRDITLISIFATVLFVQEQVLSLLPNIQLTILLLVVYSKTLGFTKTSIIIVIHTILDNLVMGSFNLLVIPFMALGWFIIPVLLFTIFKKVNSSNGLAFVGIILSLLYSWILIYPGMIIQELSFREYLIGDIVFEVVLAASSFITILWLYEPLSSLIKKLENQSE